jgi:hypothetical protein
MEIGIVSEFDYLGVLFSKSRNFSMAKKNSSRESHNIDLSDVVPVPECDQYIHVSST